MIQDKKRKYVKPQMEVYEIKGQQRLLQSSDPNLPFNPDPAKPPIPWQW